ncbi:hypothetical protein DXG01_005742 [Tephrocybe rancida]|nr:hypothetical protein DXG01_005742 [Tephrocybe rancida]
MPHKAIARCCGYRKLPPSSEPTLARSPHQRLESIDRNGGYPTAPPTFLPPPGTPQFLRPASSTYSRVPPNEQHYGGHSRGRDNWVDESVYNGRR